MKVLQVNCVYKKGSTGKIVADIHKVLLSRGYDSVVCYGRQRGQVAQEDNVYKFCSELEGDIHHFAHRYLGALMYGGCYISTRNLIGIIKREKPDVVHLQCINGYCVNIYSLIQFLAKNRVKTVVTNHAEFYYTGSCGHSFNCMKFKELKACLNCPSPTVATDSRTMCRTAAAWKKMHDAFACFKKEDVLFTAVSPWVKKRFALSPITNRFDCVVIENGLEIDTFHPWDEATRDSVRQEIGVPADGKMVFHATASFNLVETSIKGGRYIYELARRMPEVYFVVAALQYSLPEDCPENLCLIGSAKTQEHLSKLYSAADLTVIASERETFSMITAETQCCGTPIVGFEAGGPESIAVSSGAEFVMYAHVDALQQAVSRWLRKTIDKNALAQEAEKHFAREIMTEGYINAYKTILKR